MTSAFENGRILARSARNVASASQELYPMLATLWEMLEKEKTSLGRIEDAGDDETWKNEWFPLSFGHNADVFEFIERREGQKGRLRKGERLGTVTMLVRLCGDSSTNDGDADWPWLDQACLLIGWHCYEDYWIAENFDASSDNIEYVRHIGNGLWSWYEGNEDCSFFFALPIFALQSEVDLKTKVIEPLIKLFNSDAPVDLAEAAFAGVPVLTP